MDEFEMMTDPKVQQVTSLFGGTWEPEVIEDTDSVDFTKPVRGKYICEITGIEHNTGEKDGKEWENYKLKLKAVEDVDGDKSNGRFLDKVFWMGTSDWNDDPDKGKKDLFNCLHTAGLALPPATDSSVIIMHGDKLIGSKVNVTAYPNKKDKQIVRIVKEFKLKDDKKETPFPIE
jgi:hypothetical protein